MKKLINLILIIGIAAIVIAQDKKHSPQGQEPKVDSTKVKLEQIKKDYKEQNAKMDSILIEKAK